MTFQDGEEELDSQNMLNYPTGAAGLPLLLMTRDRRRVYAVLLCPTDGVKVERLDAHGIEFYSRLYKVPELLRAV